ncbi:hypothetical protein HNP99_001160 [Flavobacterium sp. 28A]|nr:hypothetical protein [Flavobacterium sp. 28A]
MKFNIFTLLKLIPVLFISIGFIIVIMMIKNDVKVI